MGIKDLYLAMRHANEIQTFWLSNFGWQILNEKEGIAMLCHLRASVEGVD